MRVLVGIGLILANAPATASQPTGKTYGRWHVFSISSLSGTEGNDASAILTQGEYPNILQVEWMTGNPITVSINIAPCAADRNFEAYRTIAVQKWLRRSREDTRKILRNYIKTWQRHARSACGPANLITLLDMTQFDAASADFDDRIRYLAAPLLD